MTNSEYRMIAGKIDQREDRGVIFNTVCRVVVPVICDPYLLVRHTDFRLESRLREHNITWEHTVSLHTIIHRRDFTRGWYTCCYSPCLPVEVVVGVRVPAFPYHDAPSHLICSRANNRACVGWSKRGCWTMSLKQLLVSHSKSL